jgi:4-aminobutyrate aminotransferase/4-aminobutyrate aminotransferase/(S)-3-amino-2-methylpropionate transaminase
MRDARTFAGPQELLRLKRQYLVPCVYHFYRDPPQIVAGSGCWLVDHTGRRYLDCFSGVTVTSAGHSNWEILEPVIQQLCTLQHTTSIYLTEPVLRLAETLAGITPAGLTRSFFCASGSEAVEGALMTASLHTKRPRIVALDSALHGRTRWAMNATGLSMWRTDPFPMDEVLRAPFGEIEPLENIFKQHGDQISAVIGEPIQGNGGIIVPPDDYWPAVSRLCMQYGALLIFDEVQTGYNRTGRWFASEHWGVVPDIMAISKAMGNGFPIAAFVTTDAIAASYTRPGASTYGGNPICATAAQAVIEYHQKHNLGARAAKAGELLASRLTEIAAAHPQLRPPRGRGLMLGMEVVDEQNQPDAARCDQYLEQLKDLGILAGKTGAQRNVLTFLPPLVICDEEIAFLIEQLGKIFS